jgi:hypothetical protein
MENRNNVLMISLIAVVVLLSWGLTKNFNEHNASIVETKTCKEDSLKTIIESLKHELEAQDNGFDSKEKRYENILFEYEFGLEHLKNYHPEAYKEFHRIVGYKENYSRETERENKKRLQAPEKW